MTTSDKSQENQLEPASSATTMDWSSIIQQWKSSGLTQTAYCKANNINYNQFVYQISKLSARTKSHSKLLPIQITQPHQFGGVQSCFILDYPNGLKLHIPLNAHPEAIKVLLNCMDQQLC